MPAGQVAPTAISNPGTAALRYQGATTTGNHRFRLDCGAWTAMSYAQKIARVTPFRPWNPAGAVKALDNICARRATLPAGMVRPAGQALPEGAVFDTSGGYTDPATGNQYDSSGNLINSSTPAALPPSITASVSTPSTPATTTTPSTTSSAASQASQTALFNTVGGALNTTGATIASIVASNNQASIAQLQAQTQQQVAALTVQAQQAQQQGNVALAQIRAQQATALAQFNGQLLTQMQPQNTGLYVVGGLVALGVVGAILYVVMKRKSG
jgi:hypothetical protein